MISNLPISYLNTPVGKVMLRKLLPNVEESILSELPKLVEDVAREGNFTIGDLLKDELIANLLSNGISHDHNENTACSIRNFIDPSSMVKCPSCKYVGAISQFAPKLFKED